MSRLFFLSKDKKGLDLYGRGGEDEVGGVKQGKP